jgi:cytoskeletal protein CcmA (bactofilin family)
MALSSFGRGREGESTPPAASAPSSPNASKPAGGLTAFIDQGSEFEGKLTFQDTVRIDGRFRGEISSQNTLIVGESGEIEASIRSSSIAISGAVEGDIAGAKKVVLHKTARVRGNIETPCIVIEEGAVFNGQVAMDSPAAKSATSGSLKAIHGGGSAAKEGKEGQEKGEPTTS